MQQLAGVGVEVGWAGIALGAATVALAVGYLILDALDTPAMARPGGTPVLGTAAVRLRSLVVWLLVPAGAGLICSGGFAWLQPGAHSVRTADLPGMAGVTGWTALAIAVALALALISMLLGLRRSRGTLTGGPWITLMLGFGTLNLLLLGAEIWVAHLVGAVTSDAAQALSAKPGQIYLPYLITSGVPLLVWAAVLAVVAFGVAEAVRWPRSYHPLSPPCYTERAVPDLQRRMWWLNNNRGRVVLVGHSQGAVLATAALVQPACRPVNGDQPALITFGSPVAKLYGWGFPAYFDAALVGPLVPGDGQPDGWRNFYYPTDPIGGPVTGGLPGTVQKRVDKEFLDPADCYYVYGQAPPAAQGHSGYWADRRVWDLINELAASGNGVPPPAI
jgi:hypothetical protein